MSAEQSEVMPPAEPTAMAEVNTAVAKFDRVALGITELRTKYEGVLYEVTTAKGMAEACAARAAIRAPRYEVEKVRKECKAPILALGKEIDARAASITAQLLALEAPIDSQVKAEEERKETERKAKAEAERLRVASIQDDIANDVRGMPAAMVGRSAADIEVTLNDVIAIEITAERFQEFAPTAASAKQLAVGKLRTMLEQQRAHEAEVERIAAERAELERQRAEQAEANRVREAAELAAAMERQQQADVDNAKLRARIEETERLEKAAREKNERIAKEHREAAQADEARRNREDAERRERIRIEDEERAKVIRAREEAIQLEQRRIAQESDQLRREQDAITTQRAAMELLLAESQKPTPVLSSSEVATAQANEFIHRISLPEESPCPTATEIAEVVAAHWRISVAEAMCLCVNVFEPGEDEDTFGLD